MAKTVASVSLTQPVSAPHIDEGLTFSMGGRIIAYLQNLGTNLR